MMEKYGIVPEDLEEEKAADAKKEEDSTEPEKKEKKTDVFGKHK